MTLLRRETETDADATDAPPPTCNVLALVCVLTYVVKTYSHNVGQRLRQGLGGQAERS